jgi:signal transduction histidine kinase
MEKMSHMAESFAGQERRSADIAALQAMSAMASADHEDRTDVVNSILEATTQILPCEDALIYLHDDALDIFRVLAKAGRDTTIPLSETSVARRIWATGRGEVLNDIEADPEFNPLIAEIVKTRQFVGAPITAEGHNFGVLAAVNAPQGFADSDLRALTILADRAAMALQLCDLRISLARQSQELEGLQRMSRLLIATESLEHVIGESVRVVCDLLECDKMAVLLYDEATNYLLPHPPAEGLEPEKLEILNIPLSQPSLIGTVYRTNTPLTSNDSQNDAWVSDAMKQTLGVETLLVSPITSGPQPIGVLVAVNSQRGQFTEEDERFITLLGGRVGGVIEASRARGRERALMQKLREADRTKSEFVSMLAHELKNPMVTISGFSEVLRDQSEKIAPEKIKEIAGILNSEVDRLARLVYDLLDLSRMEAGTVRYDLQPVSIPELVDNLLTLHTSLNAHHVVTPRLSDDLPKVLADRDRLNQVLLNLMMNAARYSPQGTEIQLLADVIDDEGTPRVRVSIKDEGIGIAPEDQDRVFSKFVMLPKPAWVKKGTGLGLFITQGIVEAHGGNIWIESEPGKGSTFHFTLDIANGNY